MKNDKNISNIEFLFETYFIETGHLSIKTIINKICQNKNKSIKLVYGETYDQYGLTIDSLKYYFFISLLAKLLEEKGFDVSSTIIVGDLHSIKNKMVENKKDLLLNAKDRINFINQIDSIYNLDIKPMLMSQMFKDKDYQKRLKKVSSIFNSSSELIEIARKTVLKNRLSQEEKVGFQYTQEEVALIIDYDIKIGPPREIYYDQIAQIINRKLLDKGFEGIYLKPTYPLGLNFGFFINNPEIEKYGITPYKAGSNRLQKNRIILKSTNLTRCKELINSSFVASNPLLPNPVLDIFLISYLAESFLKKSWQIFDNRIIEDTDLLKKTTYQKLVENIYKPLNIT